MQPFPGMSAVEDITANVSPTFGFTLGDILLSSATTITRLADVATGNVLLSGGVGVNPSWGKVTSAHVDSSVYTTGNPQINITGNAGTVTVQDEGADTTCFPLFVTAATGSLMPKTGAGAGLTFNSSNGVLSASTFNGALTGNATTASTATAVSVATDASDATSYPLFVGSATGSNAPKTNTGFVFDSISQILSVPMFSGSLTGNVTGNVSGSSGSCTGNAATVTTNANLTGPITSAGNATSVASQTGTGSVFVMNTSPTLITPLLGTPTSGTFTNCTGLPISTGVSGLGTGVATALAVNVGSAGAFVTFNGALGTPSSGTLTNCTFPTLNQNTTGSAASLSISGQTGLLSVTGLLSTNRIKTVRDAADTILELGGSYTPTGTWTNLTCVTPTLGAATGTSILLNVSTAYAAPAAGTGHISINSSNGLTFTGNGTSYDLLFVNKNGASIIAVPTGTATMEHAGAHHFVTSVAFTAASSDGRISYNSVSGLFIRSAGSAASVSITTATGGDGLTVDNNGKTVLRASTTGAASLNIGSGTAPTTPVNGDIWSDGSNLLARFGGVTYTFTKT